MGIPTSRLHALAFADAIGYAPTEAELAAWSGPGPIDPPMNVYRGRVTFIGRESLVEEHERREAYFPRKIRRARRVARCLSRLPGVRFVALTQTTALAHADDFGDLDFFVITRRGSLVLARVLATVWYALLGRRPGARRGKRDAVCLSFFVDDTHLDLSDLMLEGDDPYFRYWFLSMIPLFDDGISEAFWLANASITSRHPSARPWIGHPAVVVKRPWFRMPGLAFLDPFMRAVQSRILAAPLKALANLDTRVVVTPHVLKFHAEDGRAEIREAYRRTCHQYGLDA